MEKTDMRVVRTRTLLKNALLELLAENSLEKITVMDICEKSMIHRATFYKHFEDKYQLFSYAIEDLTKTFVASYSHLVGATDIKDIFSIATSDLLDFLEKNRNAVLAVVENNGNRATSMLFYDEIENSLCQSLSKHWQELKLVPQDIPLLSNFLAGGCISVALWWLRQGKCTKADVVKFISDYCLNMK